MSLLYYCKDFRKREKKITCLLFIVSSGDKLEPYIIFKGKKDNNVNTELSNYVSTTISGGSPLEKFKIIHEKIN